MTREKPILFKSQMVWAILTCARCGELSVPFPCRHCGSTEFVKTQTRRPLREQPGDDIDPAVLRRCVPMRQGRYEYMGTDDGHEIGIKPYCFPGDRLYVKEAHSRYGRWAVDGLTKTGRQRWRFYSNGLVDEVVKFDPQPVIPREQEGYHKRPSIFLPRSLSRIALEVVSARLEPVREISEEDAKAEGVQSCTMCGGTGLIESADGYDISCPACHQYPYTYSFMALWDFIHGPGAWDRNDWVSRIEFRRIGI